MIKAGAGAAGGEGGTEVVPRAGLGPGETRTQQSTDSGTTLPGENSGWPPQNVLRMKSSSTPADNDLTEWTFGIEWEYICRVVEGAEIFWTCGGGNQGGNFT